MPATAQPEKIETFRINLATEQVSTIEAPVDIGIKRVEILNLAPRYLDLITTSGPYVISVVRETATVQPFDYKAIGLSPPGEGSRPFQKACEELALALLGAPDEQAAALLLEKSGGVSRDCPALKSIRKRMVFVSPAYTVRRGDVLEVTIERGVGETYRKWTRRYVAPAAQPFLVTYGLNFIPRNDDEYYAKGVTSPPAGTPPYVLTQKNQANGFDYAPSVHFSYPFPFKDGHPLAWGPAAGLGFDLSSPVAFLGVALIFNQNIHLVSGAVMHQEARLRGEYTTGQPLTEHLTNDQLTEKTYRPSWFVGLSFRFSSNPFTRGTDPSKVTPKD